MRLRNAALQLVSPAEFAHIARSSSVLTALVTTVSGLWSALVTLARG